MYYMPNGSQSDQSDWRNALAGLEQVPGHEFNRDLAWEKLHHRLRPKENKKAGWYWIAASILIVVSIGGLVTLNHYSKKQATPTTTATQITVHSSKNKNGSTQIENSVGSPVQLSHLRAPRIASNRAKRHTREIVPVDVIHPMDSQLPKPTDVISEQLAFNTGNKPVAPPSSKPLKVVHINEIGDRPVFSADLAHSNDRRFIKFGSGTHQNLAGSPLESQTTGIALIKIKPASN